MMWEKGCQGKNGHMREELRLQLIMAPGEAPLTMRSPIGDISIALCGENVRAFLFSLSLSLSHSSGKLAAN